MANTKITSNVISDDIALGGNPTTTTQSAGNDTTRIATTAFVKAAIDATIDSAPGALDTLNELAAAIGDDANFSTTITNSIATKAPLASPTFTGVATAPAVTLGTDPGGDAYNATSPLKIGSTTNAYINIKAGTGHSGGLLIGDSDDDFVGGFIYSNSTDDLSIYSNNAVRMVLNDNGRVVIGGGADPRTLGFGDTGVQIEGTGATSASLSIVRNSASLDPPYLIFGKSRGGALGANTVVQDGDYLGNIRFNAADGTDAGNVAAQIHAQIDGTPGANDTPGKLVFSTTADGNNTSTARMTIRQDGKVGVATASPGQTLSVNGTIGIGTNASVGIGSTMADANIAELGPGYLNLARDDTADAKQISFSKNGVRVSDISTTDKGILWEVLESSGNAAAFQVTNGVGQTVWGSMNAQGHKWQDNVYNAFSVGGMSMGTDSSNTSHMWWNTYDTGSKHGVSAGYGMDEYVSNSTGDYSIRMSDSSGFVGDGVVLTERYRFTNKGGLNIYATGSHQEASDAKLNISKNSSNDWSIILSHGSDDYGYLAKGNGGYALGVYNQPSSSYRARINYNGEIFLNGGSSAVFNINSDVRLKEDITDCPSQWDLIKGLPLQKFHWKDRREGDKWSYGFIAQEVEKTNPEFVHVVPQDKEDFDNGIEDPEYKTVSEGQIHERALVALQEAMVRIEALEAEVAALKE